MELPATGLGTEKLRATLDSFAADDVDWRRGRGWSLVYDSPEWHRELVREAARRFTDENALSHAAFPSVARFESCVISMIASVVSPGHPAYGIFTSGGTESTLLALKAYRDASRRADGTVVVPQTAHPAFGKACAYLGLELVPVPVGRNGLPDPDEFLRAVTGRTVVAGLSAPCYPFGVVDPIAEIGARLHAREIGVHVDAALGGLFLPFLDGAPSFGFDVAGVTSVGVDVHKYGYGDKGAAVVVFGTPELRRHAYHVSLDWPGGAYASPTALGTRSVAAVASAFTALAALGRDGYRELVAHVMRTTQTLQRRLQDLGPYDIVGRPCMSVFAVTSDEISMFAIAEGLEARGWHIDAQPSPPAIHFIVSPRHAFVIDEFVEDFAAATDDAKRGVGHGRDVASYGVMVRGNEPPTRETLVKSLDARFDLPGLP